MNAFGGLAIGVWASPPLGFTGFLIGGEFAMREDGFVVGGSERIVGRTRLRASLKARSHLSGKVGSIGRGTGGLETRESSPGNLLRFSGTSCKEGSTAGM